MVPVYVNGQFVPGPTQPIEMDPPEGGYTHYLGGGYGDRPIVGLTEVEAEVVMRALGKAQRDTKFRQTGERRVPEARRKDLMMGLPAPRAAPAGGVRGGRGRGTAGCRAEYPEPMNPASARPNRR